MLCLKVVICSRESSLSNSANCVIVLSESAVISLEIKRDIMIEPQYTHHCAVAITIVCLKRQRNMSREEKERQIIYMYSL